MAKEIFKSFKELGKKLKKDKRDEKTADKIVKKMMGEDVFRRGESDKNKVVKAKNLGAAAAKKSLKKPEDLVLHQGVYKTIDDAETDDALIKNIKEIENKYDVVNWKWAHYLRQAENETNEEKKAEYKNKAELMDERRKELLSLLNDFREERGEKNTRKKQADLTQSQSAVAAVDAKKIEEGEEGKEFPKTEAIEKDNLLKDSLGAEKGREEADAGQKEKESEEDIKKDDEKSKTEKTYVHYEVERLQREIFKAERRLEAVKKDGSKKAEKYWEEQVKFFRSELEKANLKINEAKESAKNKIESKNNAVDAEMKASELLSASEPKSPNIELGKIKNQIDLLGGELVYLKKRIKKAKDEKEKTDYEKNAELVKEKREKLKTLRDELEKKIKIEKIAERKQAKPARSQLTADIAENQPKTYGGRILTDNSAPEDAQEFSRRQEEMKAREILEKTEEAEEKSESLRSSIDIAMEKTQKYAQEYEEEKDLPEAEVIEEIGSSNDSSEESTPRPAEITQKDVDELLGIEGHPLSVGEALGSVKLNQETERKIQEEAKELKKDIEKMPESEKEKIALGIRNAGFVVQEYKSKILANICERFGGSENSISRFFSALAETYRKDEKLAVKHIEEREKEGGGIIKRAQNAGYLWGNIVKFGRPVAELFGFAAGSPLRYWAIPVFAFLSRGGSALKEARLANNDIKEKMMFHDANEAADVAWKIYEIAKLKSKDGKASKEDLEKAYDENLPSDLLERLKKSEPGTAGNILGGIAQKIFRKEIELSIKHGKFSKASYAERLKDFDRMITQYGAVDEIAMAAKHMEVGGKVGVAAVSIETAYLLMKRLPEIMHLIGNLNHYPENEMLSVRKPGFEIKSLTDREGARYLENLPKVDTKEKIAALSQEILQNYQNKLATVKNGEGVWHAVYRQLEDQLKDNPAKFGLKQEDIKNASKIKEVLNHETGKLLVEQGYIKADGTEARILKPGIKVLLGQDNKIRIGEENISWKKPEIVEKISSIGNKENIQRVLHSFESKNLTDKERLLHLYDADIKAMEGNLINKGLGSAKEIERLRELKDALVQSQKLANEQKTFNEYLGYLGREIGLSNKDYESIKNVKVDEFMSKNLDKKGLLGFFGFKNFKSDLARIIKSYNLSESDRKFLTIDQAIKSKIGDGKTP